MLITNAKTLAKVLSLEILDQMQGLGYTRSFADKHKEHSEEYMTCHFIKNKREFAMMKVIDEGDGYDVSLVLFPNGSKDCCCDMRNVDGFEPFTSPNYDNPEEFDDALVQLVKMIVGNDSAIEGAYGKIGDFSGRAITQTRDERRRQGV